MSYQWQQSFRRWLTGAPKDKRDFVLSQAQQVSLSVVPDVTTWSWGNEI